MKKLTTYFDHNDDTPKSLAKRLGVKVEHIYRLRNGTRKLSRELMPKFIAETRGYFSYEDLLGVPKKRKRSGEPA